MNVMDFENGIIEAIKRLSDYDADARFNCVSIWGHKDHHIFYTVQPPFESLDELALEIINEYESGCEDL